MKAELILLKKFTELTGRTSEEVRSKLSRGVWSYGEECVKDPDGKINIDWEKYLAWVDPARVLRADQKPRNEVNKRGKKKVQKRGAKVYRDPYKV